jgi:phage terminase large subunit GpA-like protein
MLYIRGTQTMQGAISVPAKCLIHDEVDFSVPEVLEMYRHRLDAVPHDERKILEFSTPTVTGYGISARYEHGDGQEWLVRCGGCDWWGPLDYEAHTGGELLYLRCTQCGGTLDPRNGEWVAAHRGGQRQR